MAPAGANRSLVPSNAKRYPPGYLFFWAYARKHHQAVPALDRRRLDRGARLRSLLAFSGKPAGLRRLGVFLGTELFLLCHAPVRPRAEASSVLLARRHGGRNREHGRPPDRRPRLPYRLLVGDLQTRPRSAAAAGKPPRIRGGGG